MRESMREIMSDAPDDATNPRIIANNTVEYQINGERRIRLHHTDVITYLANGDVILNSGGWQTVTTKDRMRGASFNIYSIKGQWLVADGVPFYDGIIFRKGRPPKATKKDARLIKANEKLAKSIVKFCHLVDIVETLPTPNGGDCWLCAMKDSDGKSWGDQSGDVSHLQSHIKENYLHGSLLVNAMQQAGFRKEQISLHYQMNLRDTFKRTLRRYLRRQLGLPA